MAVAATSLVDEIVAELVPFITRRQRFMTRQWCRQGISMTHLHVLLLLQTEGPMSMSRLADQLDVSLPSTTGIVTRMEERRLVERSHGDDDRRLVVVSLTGGGRRALEQADLFRRQHLARALERLSQREQLNMLEAVRDLRQAFDELESTGTPRVRPVTAAPR